MCALLTGTAFAAYQDSAIIAAGSPLTVALDDRTPMKTGQPIEAHLLYAIYRDNVLVVPADTILRGTIVGLEPDRPRRLRARLRGDFTPFHKPTVQFTSIIGPHGEPVPLVSRVTTDGAPIYSLVTPAPSKGGFVHRKIDEGKARVREQIAVYTAPDKRSRLMDALYSQLPYHPELIAKETAWTMETGDDVVLGGSFALPTIACGVCDAKAAAPVPPPDASPKWTLRAYLDQPLTSLSARAGQPIVATVGMPVLNADSTVAVPQGTKLLGTVTRAKPARWFGRAGALRFDFRQIVLPEGEPTSVRATMIQADSTSGDFTLDSEGQAKPKNHLVSKLATTLVLGVLASRPLDDDHGRGKLRKDAAGSNGFGLVGRIVGLAAGSAQLATGIGAYQTALVTWDKWIARGKQVTFPRNTMVVLETTPQRGIAMPAGNR